MNMRKGALIIVSIMLALSVYGQLNSSGSNLELLAKRWAAQWIKVENSPVNDYGVYHFRKTFELSEKPETFRIHVSADNRYKLFVNGVMVSLGPARSDVYNWAYETVDIASWLRKGSNTLASVVWNFGEYNPVAQMSFRKTAFILQGNGDREQIVNTNASWRGIRNASYSPIKTDLKTYFVVGPGDSIKSSIYPWNWEMPSYDDSSWKAAVPIISGGGKGAMDYPGWQLVPRAIPQMELRDERIQKLRSVQGMPGLTGFPLDSGNYDIPKLSKVKLLLDQTYLTTAYLNLKFSKGKDARINIKYAESLYEDIPENQPIPRYKGNRNTVKGKKFWGYNDCIVADGGNNRQFTSLWWRTYRYVLLEIETASEPLVLHDIYGTFTAYPFERVSSFSSPEMSELGEILSVGWRTARLCAHESYMDCPYYEQLQYFGDTRIQAMVTLYNSRDDRLVRNAINNGRQSVITDGITMSRYPTNLHQFIPPYSIWWIATVHDYWMHRDDEEYIAAQLPYVRMILGYYERYLREDSSLARIPYWFFTDWADGFVNGEPSRLPDGQSSLQDLHFLIGLQLAADMEDNLGEKAMAIHYREIASHIVAGFRDKYWDTDRKLFADTPLRDRFSQHANILAILSGVVEGKEARELMQTLLSTQQLVKVSIYFRYYLQMALAKVGLGNDYLDMLDIWHTQLSWGLTTWAEQPEPSRSDCHAWGSSPNIEFFRIILGIQSVSPSFRKVLIAPQPGKLKILSGSIPHPKGDISVSYKIDKEGEIRAEISLPPETDGIFRWMGRSYKLKAGKQTVTSMKDSKLNE